MADLSSINASQSVKIVGSDLTGSETTPVSSTLTGDLNVADGLSDGGVFGNLNLVTANTSYEAKAGGSRLTNRKLLSIVAFDSDMFWGYANTVTTATGFPLYKGQVINLSIDANSTFQVWLVCSNSNRNARIVETP